MAATNRRYIHEIKDPLGGCIYDHHYCSYDSDLCVLFAINDHQARSFTKEYGLTEQVDLLSGNSTQVFNRLTRRVQQVIREELDKKPELYEDTGHLDEVNAELQKHYAYLVVRKGTDIIYFGDTDEKISPSCVNSCQNLISFREI